MAVTRTMALIGGASLAFAVPLMMTAGTPEKRTDGGATKHEQIRTTSYFAMGAGAAAIGATIIASMLLPKTHFAESTRLAWAGAGAVGGGYAANRIGGGEISFREIVKR